MARRAVVHLVDDLDQTVIEDGNGQIVSFGLDGTTYEIDLTNEHADELRGALSRYVGSTQDRQRPPRASPQHWPFPVQQGRHQPDRRQGVGQGQRHRSVGTRQDPAERRRPVPRCG